VRRDAVWSVFLTGAFVLVTGACRGSRGDPPGPRRQAALPVRVAPAAVQDVVYRIKALGSLEPEDLVHVTAQVEGVTSDVRFREGDRVTPETILLRIDPGRYRLEAERTKAALEQATADLERARADLERREALAENELVAAEELTRARSDVAGLTGAVEAAKAADGIARQNLRRSEVRPPTAGVIDTRTVDTGQYVKMGDALATIVDVRRLRLRFKVSDAESLLARPGGEVTFRVPSLGPRDFTGRIYHVGQVADDATRQVEVLAWVPNPGELKPGFFAEVSLAGDRHRNALVVPESAVQASEQGFVVYVVKNDKAEARPVQIGLRTGTGVVEILSGLEAGDTVVTKGSDRLADGVAVVSEAPTTKTAAGEPGTREPAAAGSR
jgi:membrane fusion protein (multidrug efflux system)